MNFKLFLTPGVYWRVIGSIFTLCLMLFLFECNSNAPMAEAIGAFEMGEIRLAYHLWVDKEEHWSPEVQRGYALMLLKGEYVEKDTKLGKAMLINAANQCDVVAMRELGLLFLRGEYVGQDFQLSYKWLHKAAQKGDTSSMNVLGWMYTNGVGIDSDLSRALFWYGISALKGNDAALDLLKYIKVYFKQEEYDIVLQSLTLWQPDLSC
ncbi:MAG: tetratricopeptide repeat protein [Pseudomonadota bacterium]|nr:tetratricopeptide repeat protein [Pseudomonadota bacterium]